jgi:hypothetical protein
VCVVRNPSYYLHIYVSSPTDFFPMLLILMPVVLALTSLASSLSFYWVGYLLFLQVERGKGNLSGLLSELMSVLPFPCQLIAARTIAALPRRAQ